VDGIRDLSSKAIPQPFSDKSVGFLSLEGGSSFPRSDCPDGLISDHDISAASQGYFLKRAVELGPQHPFGLVGFALHNGLADAEQGRDPQFKETQQLIPDQTVRFVMILTPFRVANYAVGSAQRGQHRSTDFASVSSILMRTHILSADLHKAVRERAESDAQKRIGGCHNNLYPGQELALEHVGQRRAEFRRRKGIFIHLPIAGNYDISHAYSMVKLDFVPSHQEGRFRQALSVKVLEF